MGGLPIHSMSRKGNPYDNAVMESFFKTLKPEWIGDKKPGDYSIAILASDY